MHEAPPWRLFLLLVLFGYFIPALNAQVQAGQLHLAGQFSFETYPQLQNSFKSTLQPEFGIMLSPKWSIGLSIPFQYEEATSPSRYYYRLGVGPFIRRYFDLKSGFYAIVHLQAQAQFDVHRYDGRQTFLVVQATPAISYFFSPRFAFEAGFGGFTYQTYHYRSSVQESKDSSNQLRIQSTPVLSLRFYFPRRSQSPRV